MTEWTFSCPDWADRLREMRSLVPSLPLDEAAAERAVGIFNNLHLPDVTGNPALRDAGADWFREIVRALFGSIDTETGVRMVSELFLLVPKKNSKTTNAAAIGLTALLLNERPNATFLVVGPTIKVADTCFDQAVGMIEADPEGYLAKRFHVRSHKSTIVDRTNKAKLRIKTFNMKVATGEKPVGVILDELHVMSSMKDAARVLGQLRGGMQPFPESFLVFITTQSDEPPAGVFKQELDYARQVRDGVVNGPEVRTLPVLYEFPEVVQRSDDRAWEDVSLWPQVLPNLGRSVFVDRLEREFASARQKGPAEEARWLSQHLNIQIGLGLHNDRWAGALHWLQATDPGLTLEAMLARAECCTIGIDGGGLDDLLGLAILGRERDTRRWMLWCHAWAHGEVWDRRKDIADRLDDFVTAEELTRCERPGEDTEQLADVVQDVWERGLLPEEAGIGLDPAGVAEFVDEIALRGIPDDCMKAVSQGWQLQSAILGSERRLKARTMVHGGQALMAWCAGNAKTERKGSALYVTKSASGSAKIDPLMAMFDAVQLMTRNPSASTQAVVIEDGYEVVA